MPLTDAKTITDKVSMFLGDATQTRWTPAELLNWLNDGQLEIALLIPNCNPTTSTIQLIAGSKQAAPADAISITSFVRNMGVSGTVPGGVIRSVKREFMDSYVPGWTTAASNAVVIHAVYDPQDNNQQFYVYPPQPATPSSIEIIYSKIPTKIATLDAGSKITVNDYYANALFDYILYRAFGKDSEYGGQSDRSQSHYKMFAGAIGAKFGADNDSNTKNPNK